MSNIKSFLTLFAAILYLSVYSQQVDPSRQWSMYRGKSISGYLDQANLPETWDVNTNKNIAWKTAIPGLGHSCPIVWGDQIFVTTAVSEQDEGDLKTGIYGSIGSVPDSSMHYWRVYCVDKQSGEIEWERTAYTGIPEQKRHPMSSHANCTPATNGEYVVAFFGSEGLYCYDMNGKLQWSKDFGVLKSTFFLVPDAEWEFSSSPLIHKNVVVIQCDVQENSFVAAYDIKNGHEIWKQNRDEYPGWSTPNVYSDGEKDIVAVNGYKHRGGYDFNTGEEIWRMSGGGDIPVPSPVIGNDFIYFNSAHGKVSPVYAIQKNAVGDITLEDRATSNEYVKWAKLRGGSYMGTMLLYGDYLYNARWNGRLTCYNAQTGEEMYSQKVGWGNSYTSSPVAADGVIYIVDNEGNVYAVKAGPEYELLATNKLSQIVMSTPAITKDYLLFRTADHLIAVSKVE
ncbi:outer membrane protein assembly factor BamB family protein [Draconibacterium halophilum]|uniref:PQQ-like beta-propeller repeat protein n=1 Tax=Draconibacterium halophilum TaxID=2706887 RepID=A0A6C0R7M8_9BACT|nr:PQQ-binding-like beta-propeller repeat protein [Draconibacterium halophilum]QIA06278.1 PQQ-like beta-propeller repeat protein [Draconibacterium halophilum]